MPIIHFIQPDGSETLVAANVGDSIMQSALNHKVRGILGDCNGSCSCATCHTYVDEAWMSRIPAAESYELDLLSCSSNFRPNSRLTCEITVTDELDGLVLRLPK